jgi:hypothetical protein
MYVICILSVVLIAACQLVYRAQAISIEDFGARPGHDSLQIAYLNSKAIMSAMMAANSSDDRVVVVPAGNNYFVHGIQLQNLLDITWQFDGNMTFINDIDSWSEYQYFVEITECHSFNMKGSGTVDGLGLNWWRRAYVDGGLTRPEMFRFYQSTGITITDIYFLNSPRFVLYFKDCADLLIHDITIFIDSSITRLGHDSVTYPLNTDGIDFAATNVTIYNCNITNYDDAIVAKPCRSTYKYCQCSGNALVYKNFVQYSTGLTIGSVPPHEEVNCVRNVTFRDSSMYRPLKALYIKSNPGDSGSGIIEDITYENIFIDQALWWTIYVGPQQQNEPGGGSDGTGCNFLFPMVPVCPTQPRVTMTGITFRNITAVDTLPLFEGPGVLLCDEENPCTGVTFENVTNTAFTGSVEDIFNALPIKLPAWIFPTRYRSDDWEFAYISSNVYGQNVGTVEPKVCFDESCFWDGEAKHKQQ